MLLLYTKLCALIALVRAVNKEFDTTCILKGREVDELAAFSNKLVVKENEVYLPLWNACIRGSSAHRLGQGK